MSKVYVVTTLLPRWNWLAMLGILQLATGCAVGPKYQPPSDPAPSGYKEDQPPPGDANKIWNRAQPSDAELRGKWWELFGNPELNQLEEQVELNNQTIKQYFENYMAARALIGQARSQLFPTVSIAPAYSHNYNAQGGVPAGTALNTNIYSIPLEASWAPDLWGKVRNTVKQYQYAAQLNAADLENQRLLVHANLAQYYFQLRGQDALLDILEQTVAEDQKALEYNRAQYETGVGTQLSLVEAQNTLEAAQAAATNVGIARAQYEHAMAMLLGKPPLGFAMPRKALLTAPPAIPLALPSQLLERRPDIAAAERNMATANAQIGIAEAAYYPNLSLSASAGLESTVLSSLFSWVSRFWAVGASLSETLFDGGLRRAGVDQYIAVYNANLAAYRQTVLVAFQQVEDNLSTIRILTTQIEQEQKVVQSATLYVQLERVRFETGIDPYVTVVIAQNTLLTARQTLAQLQIQQMTAAVLLIEALGGGWKRANLPTIDQVTASPSEEERSIQK